MTCIALDDEPLALRVLRHYLGHFPEVNPVGFFTDPGLARQQLADQPVDLLFLDVEMPDEGGLVFYRSLSYPPPVVFTTAYRQYAVEGFELAAIDYLVKPFSEDRLGQALERARRRLEHALPRPAEPGYLMIHSEYEVVRLPLSELYLAEVFGDYLKLHLADRERPVITLLSLRKLAERLPPGRFTRVHRSFLVADRYVTGRKGKRLIVRDQPVPIGRTYFLDVRERFGG